MTVDFTQPIKLDIGSGGRRPGVNWITLDFDPATKPDILHDLNESWPLKDNSCEIIRAYHVMEHVYPDKRLHLMKEIYRCLIPGGRLDFALPVATSPEFWQDPTHYAGWVPNSFMYYEDGNTFQIAFQKRHSGITPRFKKIEFGMVERKDDIEPFELKGILEAVK